MPTPTTSNIWAAIGDSICLNAPTRADRPWPATLDLLVHPTRGVANRGKNSTQAAAWLTRWTNTIRSKGYYGVILGPGAVNDQLNDTAAATTYANLNQIVTEALSDGLRVVWINCLPWGTNASWTAGRQTLLTTLNASIAARASNALLAKVDAYPSFGDTNPANMALAWQGDDTDGMHIGQAGGDRLAALVKTAMDTL